MKKLTPKRAAIRQGKQARMRALVDTILSKRPKKLWLEEFLKGKA